MSCSSNRKVIINNPEDVVREKESIVVGTIEVYLSAQEDVFGGRSTSFPDNYIAFTNDLFDTPLNILLSNSSKSFELKCNNNFPSLRDPHEKLILKFNISAICEPGKYFIYSPNIFAAVAPGAPRKTDVIREFDVLPNSIVNLGKTKIFLRENTKSNNPTIRGLDLLSPTYDDYIHTPLKVSYSYDLEDNEALELFSINYPKIFKSYDIKITHSSLSAIATKTFTTEGLSDVCFTDENNGTTVGWGGTIFRTTDGGNIWVQQESGTTRGLLAVCFTDANYGTVVGTDGVILHTTNGGKKWVHQTSGTKTFLWSVSFKDSIHGYLVHWMGSILQTTDGGKTWVEKFHEPKNGLYCVYLSDSIHCTVVGGNGVILHSTNGGVSWELQTSGTSAILESVFFTDTNNGTVVGHKGTILHTTDSGNTWVPQAREIEFSFNSVFFTDKNTGTIVGDDGIILHTTNGGTTWETVPSGTKYDLNGVNFRDSKRGVIVGDGGTILRTIDGGITFTD